MLRDPSLVVLSHQHQHALGVCVRVDRALLHGETSRDELSSDILGLWAAEIERHFEAEETILFPACRAAGMEALVDELLAEHAELRTCQHRIDLGPVRLEDVRHFVDTLSAHVRKEERQLFEGCQKLIKPAEMSKLGDAIKEFFD
jgi:hemerythrin superfamily protein